MIIEARDVEKSFGQTPALRGATVSAKRGEVLAIMGPSGSGKSTLLHCLAGILTPDRGEVRFDGQRLDTLKEAERSGLRRDNFGFVFQFGQLVPELTALDLVDDVADHRPGSVPLRLTPGASIASACLSTEIDIGGQDDHHGEGDPDRPSRAMQQVR